MIQITERENGTRRVAVVFDESEKVLVRKSNDRKAVYEYFPSRSRTKPEFHKDSDINRIIKKYKRTGILGDPLAYRDMKFGDFSTGNDFAEMSIKVKDAQYDFDQLPSVVRTRFGNDPKQLLDFLADSKNDAEAVKLGLRNPPKYERKQENGFSVLYKDGVELTRHPIPAAPAGAPSGVGTPSVAPATGGGSAAPKP